LLAKIQRKISRYLWKIESDCARW